MLLSTPLGDCPDRDFADTGTALLLLPLLLPLSLLEEALEELLCRGERYTLASGCFVSGDSLVPSPSHPSFYLAAMKKK